MASEGDRTINLKNKCLNGNEWSRYPAKEDVDIACYDINDVGGITFCQSGVIFSDGGDALDISGTVIFASPPQTSVAPTEGNDLANKTYVDSFGELWAQFPATQTVDMSCNDISGAGNIRFCEGDSSITATATSFDISSNNGITISSDVSMNFFINSGLSTLPLNIQSSGIQPTGVFDASGSLGVANNLLTSTGSLILWRSLATLLSTGMTATGGTITTFLSNGIQYTAHVFTATDATGFTITNLGSDPMPTLDILMIGGGGSGGSGAIGGTGNGGGGGAGAVMIFMNIPLIPFNNTPPYGAASPPFNFPNVTIGAGGTAVTDARGNTGGNTSITFPQELAINHAPTTSSPELTVVCPGGGGGSGGGLAALSGASGYTNFIAGSGTANIATRGGGGGGASGTGAITTAGQSTAFTSQGLGDRQGFSYTGGARNGGVGSATAGDAGAGGGGARGTGFNTGTSGISLGTQCTPGGGGLRINFDGANRSIGGGGQGAGGARPPTTSIGNSYGGGLGYSSVGPSVATAGVANTGGGGGAVGGQPSGAGGSGLVVFRYRS